MQTSSNIFENADEVCTPSALFFSAFFYLTFYADASFNKSDGWKLNSKTMTFLLS